MSFSNTALNSRSMSTIYALLWLIPGYIAFQIHNANRPLRNKTSWDLLFPISIYSAICVVLARGMVSIVTLFFLRPNIAPFGDKIRFLWHSISPFPFSATLMLAVLAAIVVGQKAECFIAKFKSIFGVKISFRGYETDPYFVKCASLVSEGVLTIAGLKNGKYYVGKLLKFTPDPNESLKSILLAPIFSGSRVSSKKTHTIEGVNTETTETVLQYDTFYIDPAELIIDLQRLIWIPVSEIVTLAKYDEELSKQFHADGISRVKWPKRFEDYVSNS